MEEVIKRLDKIAALLECQNLAQKALFNFNETCQYLDVSESHLYKLTSARQIPHFCPQGKKLYFKREELNEWLQRNRQLTNAQVEANVELELSTQKRKK